VAHSHVQVKAWEGAGSGGVRGMHVQGDHVVEMDITKKRKHDSGPYSRTLNTHRFVDVCIQSIANN